MPDAEADLIAAAGFGFLFVDRDGRVLSANRPACELLGRQQDELIGRPIAELVHPDDRGWGEAEFELLLAGANNRVHRHFRLQTGDGAERWFELDAHPAAPTAGRSVALVVMLEDAGDAALRERELRRLADTDPLTELYNRRRFAVELERHLALSKRYGTRGTLLLLDIDHLKQINDLDGHRTGDKTIVKTADLLRSTLRASDTIARIGGDEFAVLLPHADVQTAAAIATALLQKAAAELINPEGRSLALSIGIVDVPDTPEEPADVIERADAAMYTVKAVGGNGYAVDGEKPFHHGAALPSQGTEGIAAGSNHSPDGDSDHDQLTTVLETVAELGGASRGLIAWELGTDEQALSPAWSAALRAGLIERARFEEVDQEWQYRLTERGQARLDALRDPDGR